MQRGPPPPHHHHLSCSIALSAVCCACLLQEEFEASKKDCFALSWNPSPFDPPMLAVGSQASVKVWEYHHKYQKWQAVAELDGFNDIIHDVAWAPNMGR